MEIYAKEEDSEETAVDIPSEDDESSMRAMSISISDVHGVTGFVLPGDRVDIMLTRNSYTDILLQNIKILAIDHLADQRADQLKSGRTAAVEVNTVDAQKLTLAQTSGTLSLALRAAGSVEPAAPRRIQLKDLGPAFEIYSDRKKKDGEESPADLKGKDVESRRLQALEDQIRQESQEFRGTQPGFEAMRGFCGCRPNCVGQGTAEYAVFCRFKPIDTGDVSKLNPNAPLENR